MSWSLERRQRCLRAKGTRWAAPPGEGHPAVQRAPLDMYVAVRARSWAKGDVGGRQVLMGGGSGSTAAVIKWLWGARRGPRLGCRGPFEASWRDVGACPASAGRLPRPRACCDAFCCPERMILWHSPTHRLASSSASTPPLRSIAPGRCAVSAQDVAWAVVPTSFPAARAPNSRLSLTTADTSSLCA